MIAYLDWEQLSDEAIEALSRGDEPPPYPTDIGYRACGAWIAINGAWWMCENEHGPVQCSADGRWHRCDETSWIDSGPDATLWPTRPAPEGGVPPP